jgi:AraC-like DNA-binding protein
LKSLSFKAWPDGAAADGHVRVGPLLGVTTVLRKAGIDPATMFAEVGLRADVFDDPDNLISFRTAGHLLAVCVDRTGYEDFGLQAGRMSGAATLGIAGFLVQQSPTVRVALRNLTLHLHLQDRGAVPMFSVGEGTALLGYAIYQPGVEAVEQINDLAIAIAFNLMRGLCGEEWLPSEVRLARRDPVDTRPYRALFRAPVVFDAKESVLLFPSRWLERPVRGADPQLLKFLEQRVAELESEDRRTLAQRLRPMIRGALSYRDCSAERIAAMLSMHRRTLNRRLKEDGTSFREVVESVRHEVARQLLANTRLPLNEIATALDYADPSVFTRAFRRWSGLSPSEWREAEGRARR